MPSSPTVWRRWLAHELLRLRLAAGFERAQVAERIRCTSQKIGHLETATVPPKIKDLEDILLPMYGVPRECWHRYLQAARDARQKGWWESHTEAMSNWFSLYVGLEYGASGLHCWEPHLINGLLQTQAYAAAVLRAGTEKRSEAQLEQQSKLRLQRQRILDHEDPPELWVVLDESVLHANVGGAEVMLAQLHHVLEAARRPKVTVQVLPRNAGPHPGMLGAFTLLDFPTEGDPGAVYLEHRTGALYLEHTSELNDYRAAWQRLAGLALSPTASTELITETARGLR